MTQQRRVPDPLTSRAGTWGWVALAAGVLAWDLLAHETLTAAFRRAHGHPASLVAVGVAWGLLTGHLFGVLGDADPLRREHVASATAMARRTVQRRVPVLHG